MFVFRNFTIENLFPDDFVYSAYDDISYIPLEEQELVWLYQPPINFSQKNKAEIINSYFDKLYFVISSLKDDQRLFVCSLLDIFPTNIVDSDTLVSEAVQSFNERAKDISKTNVNIRFIDISEYFSQFPMCDWINWKYYFISQMIVSPIVAQGFYTWFSHRIEQLRGYRKKCIVLDLDNTLWSGILGEDGPNGIKIGGGYPGNVYQYFQEALLALADTGVILAVCSKNNEEEVKELWAKNPFVKITDKQLSSWRINWNNKADNIREIANELNIGLDSLVFIDDNPTERELIKQQLPMVAVPEFPPKPYQLILTIRDIELQYFRPSRITFEDLSKTDQYKANSKRAQASKSFTNLTEFIKSLDINIDIFKADSFTIQRIAQMTQKTNQFNLTTRRYQDSDIKNYLDKGYWVIGASVRDKFGDNGVTAASIIEINGNKAHIDSFLMSCRILGKDIEIIFLKSILNELIKIGVVEVTAEYIPTLKNNQVSHFYSDNGFNIEKTGDDGKIDYKITLTGSYPINNSYKLNIKIQ